MTCCKDFCGWGYGFKHFSTKTRLVPRTPMARQRPLHETQKKSSVVCGEGPAETSEEAHREQRREEYQGSTKRSAGTAVQDIQQEMLTEAKEDDAMLSLSSLCRGLCWVAPGLEVQAAQYQYPLLDQALCMTEVTEERAWIRKFKVSSLRVMRGSSRLRS